MPNKSDRLVHGPIGPRAVHICVDMQRLFSEKTPWHTPWMMRVVPQVVGLAARSPERTIFTRFIPAERPGEGRGTWRRYYERWADITLQRLPPDMVDLVPELARLSPPALVLDKHVYSPWLETGLAAELERRGTDTLIVSGGETDVCVLSTVMGAVDRGYRVIVATDALCSSCDATHEASLELYAARFGEQIEAVTTEVILADWM